MEGRGTDGIERQAMEGGADVGDGKWQCQLRETERGAAPAVGRRVTMEVGASTWEDGERGRRRWGGGRRRR
jgi:hypothetical protein